MKISWPTAVVLAVGIAASVALTMSGHPIPAWLSGPLGLVIGAVMPALAGKSAVAP